VTRAVPSLTGWLDEPAAGCGIRFYDGSRWEFVSYAELAGGVFAAAGHLRAHGVRGADRVALALPSGAPFVRYFFAAVLLGAAPTPIAPPGYSGSGDYAGFALPRLEVLRPACVVAEPETIGMLERRAKPAADAPPRFIAPSDDQVLDGFAHARPAAPEDIALIQFTSGSSSMPRAVTLTGSAVLTQVSLLATMIEYGSGESYSSWLPLHHDMGLIGLFLMPLMLGADLWLMRPEHFVRRPVEWLATFGRHGARRSAVPCFGLAQLVRRVSPESLQGMDFSDWQTLIVGADRISYRTLRDAYRLLAPHGMPVLTISPAYGMAEATLAVTVTRRSLPATAVAMESVEFRSGAAVRVLAEHSLADPDQPGGQITGHQVVSCGHEPPGVEVTVIGERGEPLADGHVGELRLLSPTLSEGYLGDSGASERFTVAGYHTGDLGFRLRDQIYVLGRAGDSVKVNGRFVTAEDVELALMPVLNVPQDSIAVVLRDTHDTPVAVITVQQRGAAVDAERIGDVVSAFGLDPRRFCVLEVPRRAVPRTTSGKPRRGQLWRELESGVAAGDVLYAADDFPFRFVFDAVLPAAAPARDTCGGKGYGLAVMQAEHLPVPPFIVLGTAEFAAGAAGPARLRPRLDGLTTAAAAAFGVSERTVGLAVRSSPPVSMPGMMDTLLGLGLMPDCLGALADRMGSEEAAWETLAGQAVQLCRHVAGATAEALATAADRAVPADRRWESLSALFTELTGGPYPATAAEQVSAAITAVRDSWYSERSVAYRRAHSIPDEPGPAVVIQAMAYGAASDLSASGVVFSHNPLTGEPGLFGEFLPAATGEALVSGIRTPAPVALLGKASQVLFDQLQTRADELYRLLTVMVEVEFVIERGRLWLVQVRPAVATPHALNRVCVRAWQDGLIPPGDALLRLDVDAMFEPLPAQAVPGPGASLLAVGLPACPGAFTGRVETRADTVLSGTPSELVLLRPTTEPSDFAAMLNAGALLTIEGGTTSHAAVVAREIGIPAVVGLRTLSAEFDAAPAVTVCGTTGRVWAGKVPLSASAPPSRPGGLLAVAPQPPGVLLCLSAANSPGQSGCVLDQDTDVPIGVPFPGEPVPDVLRATVCADPAGLPRAMEGQIIATSDAPTAQDWALKGGRVVFLPPEAAGAEWRTSLPACELAAVVLASSAQREHASWLLAQRAVRALDSDDRREP
jgi:acyl-CoA synthetase (AMP-forming)/AMP-acid ligase II/phosphohistidine swiveling domain-containing protein